MLRTKSFLIAAAALTGLSLCGTAKAHGRYYHHRHHVHYHSETYIYRHHHRHAGYPVTIGYGETIVSGRTGLHRSDFGVMVPDGTEPNFVLSGRRSGTGLGANGLPGSNVDNQ